MDESQCSELWFNVKKARLESYILYNSIYITLRERPDYGDNEVNGCQELGVAEGLISGQKRELWGMTEIF